jgi:hypothetical protein
MLQAISKQTAERCIKLVSQFEVIGQYCNSEFHSDIYVSELLLLLLLLSSLLSLDLQLSAGYGLLVHEISWSHITTRHSR